MIIRPEASGDEQAIHDLTQTAFANMWFSDGTECSIIDALRKDGDLTLSFVAVEGDRIVGHVAFSPVKIEGHDGWFGLGPISVSPDLQRRGIGKALIGTGLNQLRQRGANGCALIGDPGYYSQVGFVSNGKLQHGDLEAQYVQFIVFQGPEPSGRLKFAPGFGPE
jgi:putative acetyltransferase